MACREIEIEITSEGIVKGDIKGFKGPVCKEIAKILAGIVGEEVSFEPTAEFYESGIQTDVDVEDKF